MLGTAPRVFLTETKTMRLSAEQQKAIRDVVLSLAGERARIVVFGSRLDDFGRGGDIDLMIETDRKLGVLDKARIKMQLEGRLGLPVDVLAHMRGKPMTPFQRIAHETGIAIQGNES